MILRVHKPCTRRKQYETASWYTEVLLEPGDYPVNASGPLPYFRDTVIPGVITKEHFPSGYAGFYQANPNDGKNVGQPTNFFMKLPDSCDDPDSEYGTKGRERFNEWHKGELELLDIG